MENITIIEPRTISTSITMVSEPQAVQTIPDEPPQPDKSFTPQPQSSYTCSFCNAKQNSQSNLIRHLNQHVNFNGSRANSIDLEKGFMSLKVPHSVQPDVMKTKFMCLSCGKMFVKEQQVKIHLNVHYGDNIYNCRFCEKVFANYATFEVRNVLQENYFRSVVKGCVMHA